MGNSNDAQANSAGAFRALEQGTRKFPRRNSVPRLTYKPIESTDGQELNDTFDFLLDRFFDKRVDPM
jgi:hypothetical protein